MHVERNTISRRQKADDLLRYQQNINNENRRIYNWSWLLLMWSSSSSLSSESLVSIVMIASFRVNVVGLVFKCWILSVRKCDKTNKLANRQTKTKTKTKNRQIDKPINEHNKPTPNQQTHQLFPMKTLNSKPSASSEGTVGTSDKNRV